MATKLVECIPNFSCSKEKDETAYNALVEVAKSVPGCTLFDAQTDGNHNRCVFTLLGGLLVILAVQVVVMALYAYFVVFRVLGKNYDAAIMCSGLCGHGLGATPSAIVNMTAVCEKYGMSRRAFMVVPIVGAFLVDIIYQPQTIAFIKFFVHGFTG